MLYNYHIVSTRGRQHTLIDQATQHIHSVTEPPFWSMTICL